MCISTSCGEESSDDLNIASSSLFAEQLPSKTGITFNNKLVFTEEYNPYTFKNFFNGGGVALGDVNGDNLLDIYFAGNLVGNKLYINKGGLVFEDRTNDAGVACNDVWSSGVSMVDIDADGDLDIYVCKSGRPDVNGVRHNQLFINHGDGTFVDASVEYGLDFTGLSVQAVFFDYDLDGDLDCYLLNNSIRSVGGVDMVEGLRNIRAEDGGNKLLKSMLAESKGREKKFVDVTAEAGIYESDIGFGLGVSVSDLNGDGWPDLFVSNDFFEKDYVYINNKKGSFTEVSDMSMAELSMGSMGADIADLNNDGRPDIFVTEMLPASLERTKTKIVFENYEKSQLAWSKGYHRQFARNALHYNRSQKDGNAPPVFSEISRYAGVDATEWSWGALIEDFDQDGFKDIFVANGIYRDLLDQDYLNFFQPDEVRRRLRQGEENVVITMFDKMPKSLYPNYLFKNNGDLTFDDISVLSGIGTKPRYSNGSAYGDLDNDGDLDIVTNNIGASASIYQNTNDQPSLCMTLVGSGYNTQCIGATVFVYSRAGQILKEVFPMRGFQSSVDPRVHLAIANIDVDSIVVVWPDHSRSTYEGRLPDTASISYTWKHANGGASSLRPSNVYNETLLSPSHIVDSTYSHMENRHSDFDRVRTLPAIISNEGPRLFVEDISGDGLDDLIVSSSKGSSAAAFLNSGRQLNASKILEQVNVASESLDLLVCDIDDDGSTDLFFANGSSEFGKASSSIRDEWYRWVDGKWKVASSESANFAFSSSSSVERIDLDLDGDLDVIVGERMIPNAYGVPANIIRYRNDGGSFVRIEPTGVFREVGLIRDLLVVDINDDRYEDIIVVREYDALEILLSDGKGGFVKGSESMGLAAHKGVWTRAKVADIDLDGDMDIICTNIGTNNRIARLTDSIAVLYVNDFDHNGSVETVLCRRDERVGDYPMVLRDDLVAQVPMLKKRALGYEDYAVMTMKDLFDENVLSSSLLYSVNEYRSGIFINEGGSFRFAPLPMQAQWTDQRAIWVGDLNGDNLSDIILGGNQLYAKPELGISAASYGQVFVQDQSNNFRYLSADKSGLKETGQIRDIQSISVGGESYIVFAKNNESLSTYKIEKKK